MKYWEKNSKQKWFFDAVIVVAVAFILSFVVAFLFALIPGVEFNEYSERNSSLISRDSLSSAQGTVYYIVDDDVRSMSGNNINIDSLVSKIKLSQNGSHREFMSTAIYREWDYKIFLTLILIIYGFLVLGFFDDYFPRSSAVTESGIHAKLNYQRIADKKTRKLTLLMTFIIAYVIFFALIIFRFASEIDTIIHDEDIEAYDKWIDKVDEHVNKDENLVEKNTMIFWGVYFTRFLMVRMLIAVVAILFFSFLLRLYNITRRDRDLLVQKEEALSALHYISRGEWLYQYDNEGYALFKSKVGNKILNEIELKKEDIEDYVRLYITDDEKSNTISTKDFISLIPMNELFRISDYDVKKSRKSDNESIEIVHDNAAVINELKDLNGNILEVLGKL